MIILKIPSGIFNIRVKGHKKRKQKGDKIEMRKVKSLAAVLLAAVMMVGSVMPASAAVTYERKYEDGSVYVKTDNAAKYDNYPVWVWWQGYCYYYDSPYNYLKNCITPDGYTVDEFGRWTENGVAVHNGFGSVKVGTDEYLGKSSDEIWSLMKENLIEAYSTAIISNASKNIKTSTGHVINKKTYAYGYGDKDVWTDFDTTLYGGPGETYVMHDHSGLKTFVTAVIGNVWSDNANDVTNSLNMAEYANKPDIKEKTIKAVVGDKVGQELFNYIKQHADKKSEGLKIVLDANGKPIMGMYEWDWDENGNKVDLGFFENPKGTQYKREYAVLGNGIDASTLDLSAWQNRTTDYGKKFNVTNEGRVINIHVYN